VLFVSHNMSAVRSLTTTAVLLAGGRLVAHGPVPEVISKYLQDEDSVLRSELRYLPDEAATGIAALRAIRLLDCDGRQRSEFTSDEPVVVEIDFTASPAPYLQVGIEVRNQHGAPVFHTFSNDVADVWPMVGGQAGSYAARCEIPPCLLNGGQYNVRPMIKSESDARPVIPERAPLLRVEFDVPNRSLIISGRAGAVAPIIPWRMRPTEEHAPHDVLNATLDVSAGQTIGH
jgi:lipopolysaccharide transport system ATP-binding protein